MNNVLLKKFPPADSGFSQKVSLNLCAKLTQLLWKESAELRQLRLSANVFSNIVKSGD